MASHQPPILLAVDSEIAAEMVVAFNEDDLRYAPSLRSAELAQFGDIILIATGGAADLITLIVAWPTIEAFASRLLDACRRKPRATLSLSFRDGSHRVELDVATSNPSQVVAALQSLASTLEQRVD
jgi:hypothetical protein